MRRILIINVLPLVLFAAGLLYLDNYRQGLIAGETAALLNEGRLVAGALGSTVVVVGAGDDPGSIDTGEARALIRRLSGSTASRYRLFGPGGAMIADSRDLETAGGDVQAEELPPPGMMRRWWDRIYRIVMAPLPRLTPLPLYREAASQRARDYPEVMRALDGGDGSALRDGGRDSDILTVAVPVQRFKQVLGALMVSTQMTRSDQELREVRSTIFFLFALTLGLTVLLSLYLASTIARPVRRLAAAADLVRQGRGHADAIPDFTDHGDEVGELSAALIEMTETLGRRMDATERFAADVAHEIKNPLTSLRSAIEVAARVSEPAQRERLLLLALDDVRRLDRLITDIANASRLDAEMSRDDAVPVDLTTLLETLVEVQPEGGTAVALDSEGDLTVSGNESRLGQVFRNLVDNALSFSPPGGTIRIRGRRIDADVEVTVEDQGPGIPDNRLEAVFDRFYSQRPQGEAFGTHSGLGLSIARQIVAGLGGTIRAENVGPDPDRPEGARFQVVIPSGLRR
ncbi:MAG: HAMP domain-containing protein [Alphaproteobacteria bacterium]|nr:HAMP domain-containing protein [Alphaproteobacteria bacterium]